MLTPFPSLDQVYNMVIREENQRGLFHQDQSFTTDHLAMSVKKGKNEMICSHCHRSGHSTATCYKIIGYPPGFKSTKNKPKYYSSANQVAAASSSSGVKSDVAWNTFLNLSKAQIEKLFALIGDDSGQSSGATMHDTHLANVAGPLQLEDDWTG